MLFYRYSLSFRRAHCLYTQYTHTHCGVWIPTHLLTSLHKYPDFVILEYDIQFLFIYVHYANFVATFLFQAPTSAAVVTVYHSLSSVFVPCLHLALSLFLF